MYIMLNNFYRYINCSCKWMIVFIEFYLNFLLSFRSPGYGITLVAETTNGVFYTAEAVSEPSGSEKEFKTPEDVAKNAVYDLYEEIYRVQLINLNIIIY